MDLCASPIECGHPLSDHDDADGQGCRGAVNVKWCTGPDPIDEAERCHCPQFVNTEAIPQPEGTR